MTKMTKSFHKRQWNQDVLLLANHLEIESLGTESGFYQRKPKKITATSLFISLWLMQQLGKNTLRNWACQLGQHIGQSVSKQSINERLTQTSVELSKMALEKALNVKMDEEELSKESKQFKKELNLFHRIIIRDSTVQQLPSHLHEVFKGSYSHGNPTSMMRIQALFNFSEKRWEDFQIGAYTDNDQGAADCIANFLRPHDLLLQDLGYFTLNWIEQLIDNQVFIITKWDNKTYLYDLEGNKIELLDLLQNQRCVDQAVLVGSKKKIPMRLVVRKLPKAKARKRIESAKKDRHSRSNHSDQYYELLKYEIYLTNVDQKLLKPKRIAQLYGLRWHIEILFKSWKSYANFEEMFDKDRMNEHRVWFTIYVVLIQFVWLKGVVYNYVEDKVKQIKPLHHISILKFMDVVNDLLSFILLIYSLSQIDPLIPQFTAHATYEKRKKRKNTIEKYLYVNELCIVNS